MNDENLKPIKKGDLSPEELKKRQRNGGIKSGEVRRRNRTMRETFELLLDKEVDTKEGKKTTMEVMSIRIIQKAINGDIRAYELIRDTIGQKPSDKTELTALDSSVVINIQPVKAVEKGGN